MNINKISQVDSSSVLLAVRAEAMRGAESSPSMFILQALLWNFQLFFAITSFEGAVLNSLYRFWYSSTNSFI